jgi:hypothetical protein
MGSSHWLIKITNDIGTNNADSQKKSNVTPKNPSEETKSYFQGSQNVRPTTHKIFLYFGTKIRLTVPASLGVT